MKTDRQRRNGSDKGIRRLIGAKKHGRATPDGAYSSRDGAIAVGPQVPMPQKKPNFFVRTIKEQRPSASAMLISLSEASISTMVIEEPPKRSPWRVPERQKERGSAHLPSPGLNMLPWPSASCGRSKAVAIRVASSTSLLCLGIRSDPRRV